MSSKSWCRRCDPATSSSSTTSPSTSNPRSAWQLSTRLLRFLPPYSPDFNPIEQAFAKLKAFLRAARPRTFDRVATLVGDALNLFTVTECGNYVRHCGYRLAVTVMKNALIIRDDQGPRTPGPPRTKYGR